METYRSNPALLLLTTFCLRIQFINVLEKYIYIFSNGYSQHVILSLTIYENAFPKFSVILSWLQQHANIPLTIYEALSHKSFGIRSWLQQHINSPLQVHELHFANLLSFRILSKRNTGRLQLFHKLTVLFKTVEYRNLKLAKNVG